MWAHPLYLATGILKWIMWSQVSQASLATVRTVETGRGDLLAFLECPVSLGLQVQLVPTVTATHQHATSSQGPPTSLWMWRDLQGTKSHSGRDRKTVGLASLSTQHFSHFLPRGCGWYGAFHPLTSSLVSMFCASHISVRRSQLLHKKHKTLFFLWAAKICLVLVFFCLRDVLIFSGRCAHISEMKRNDHVCGNVCLSHSPSTFLAVYSFYHIKPPPHYHRTFQIITQIKSGSVRLIQVPFSNILFCMC